MFKLHYCKKAQQFLDRPLTLVLCSKRFITLHERHIWLFLRPKTQNCDNLKEVWLNLNLPNEPVLLI